MCQGQSLTVHSLALDHKRVTNQIFALLEPCAKEINVHVLLVPFHSNKAFSKPRVINMVWVDLFKQDHTK